MSLSCAVCGGCARSPQSVLANMTELWSPWLHHILHYYMLAASKDIALYSCNTFTVCKLFHMFDAMVFAVFGWKAHPIPVVGCPP